LPKKSIGTVIIGGKRMFCNPLDADRTDDEKRWIKERIQVFKKEPPMGLLARLVEYMFVADIDEHWTNCERLLSQTLKHPSAKRLLEQALVRNAKPDCDRLYDYGLKP
jgi:hypothetical protein